MNSVFRWHYFRFNVTNKYIKKNKCWYIHDRVLIYLCRTHFIKLNNNFKFISTMTTLISNIIILTSPLTSHNFRLAKINLLCHHTICFFFRCKTNYVIAIWRKNCWSLNTYHVFIKTSEVITFWISKVIQIWKYF